MKGKLHKSKHGWLVEYGHGLNLPLHSEDAEAIEGLFSDKIFMSPENDEINFKIVDIPLEPAGNNIWVSRFAKIVWE